MMFVGGFNYLDIYPLQIQLEPKIYYEEKKKKKGTSKTFPNH